MKTEDRIKTINPLTSIRGAAAFWVVYHHYSGIDSYPFEPYWLTFLRRGFLGVDIFFILSGFIMSYCYAHFFTTAGLSKKMYFRFLGLRLARIYPLHFFVLTLFFVLTFENFLPHHAYAKNYDFQWAYWTSLIQSLLLIQAWDIDQQLWNGVAWTISVEWFLYLLFPAAIIFCMRLPKLAVCGFLIPLYLVIAFSQANDPIFWAQLHSGVPCGALFRGCAGYFTGILLYRLYKDKVLFSLPWKLIGNVSAILIPVVVLGVHQIAFILPLFALLIYALAHPSNARHSLWNSRPMIFLGDISYSIYMIQLFILSAFIHPNLHWLFITKICCLLFTVVIIIFSCITWRFIEKPSRRYIRKRWLGSEAAEMPVTEAAAP